MYAKTDEVGIIRDMHNQALLSNDISSLRAHREEISRKRELHNKLNDINIMKEQIKECLSLRDEILDIKLMLYIHIQRENKCQA